MTKQNSGNIIVSVSNVKKKLKRDIKEFAKKFVKEKKLMERLASIAAGDSIDYVREQVINGKIQKVYVPAPVREQRGAICDLLDRGYGKSAQELVHSGNPDAPINWLERREALIESLSADSK